MPIRVYYCYIVMDTNHTTVQYRKVQGLIGETSFSVILPKQYAINLGIGKGDFVKVHQDDNKIIVEKADS
jgi:Antidote-toxin recognition MazE, bacterial antitoxin